MKPPGPNFRTVRLPAALLVAISGPIHAEVTGAPPRLTAAPGDDSRACTRCHSSTALNSGAGAVRIHLPGDRTYAPGVRQRILVAVSDPTQRRWGFQLTARVASNASSSQAGDLSSVDGLTQVICDNGRAKPCASASVVQFVTHTLAGTRNGTMGSATFEFDWTPPGADVGRITLYAAGNAANGDNRNTGDRIYTTSIDLEPASNVPRPSISAERGVLNAASFQPGIGSGAWTTILGANLSPATRTWTAEDLAGGSLPTLLDGVGVTINGKPAYVQFISPTQINVLAPADDSVGPVEVRVINNRQNSDPAFTNLQSLSPAFFTFDGKYLAAARANGSLVGRPGLFPSAPDATTAAMPGETIVLYGTGFGPVDPAVVPGRLTDRVSNLIASLSVTIGGLPSRVAFAGLVPPFAQLYQFNIQVPEGLTAGDHAVVAEIQSYNSRRDSDCCFVTVQR